MSFTQAQLDRAAGVAAEPAPADVVGDAALVEAEHADGPVGEPTAWSSGVGDDEDAMTVEPVELPELPAAAPVWTGAVGGSLGEPRDLRLLADVQVELAVELGRTKLPMRQLLSLSPGSVVDLDRQADASVDVLVNGTVVARGEVFVVDGEFGVRITEIVGRA